MYNNMSMNQLSILFMMFLYLDYILYCRVGMKKEHVTWIVGLTHHVPAIYFSYSVLSDTNSWENKESYVSPLSTGMICYTSAYFMYDVVVLMTRQSIVKHLDYYVHAIGCCSAYLYMFHAQKYHYYGAGFLTWETSTPFLYLALWMSQNEKTDTLLFKLNSIALLSTFFIFRICFGTYFMFYMIWPHISLYFRIVSISLQVLNMTWFSKLAYKSVQYMLK